MRCSQGLFGKGRVLAESTKEPLGQALAELNDEELRGFDKTREELETQAEPQKCWLNLSI